VLFVYYTPDFEVHGGATAWVGFGFEPVYRGRHEYRRMLATFDEVFESLRLDAREIIDAGGDLFACRIDFVVVARGG
jgi:hypothetical protein